MNCCKLTKVQRAIKGQKTRTKVNQSSCALLKPNCVDRPAPMCIGGTNRLFAPPTTRILRLHSGLGAVCYQRENGKMQVIVYGSHTLTAAEKKTTYMQEKWNS